MRATIYACNIKKKKLTYNIMPRLLCKPRVIYLCDCGRYSGQAEEKLDLSTAKGVQQAHNTLLTLAQALPGVTKGGQAAIAKAIVTAATGANASGNGKIDLSTEAGLEIVKKTIDALAKSGTTLSPENIAKQIIRSVAHGGKGLDLSTAEGRRHAQQTIREVVQVLQGVSEADQHAVADEIFDAAIHKKIDLSTETGLETLENTVDALAHSGTTQRPEPIARHIIRTVSHGGKGLDLSTAEGVRRAQQEMRELSTRPDIESQNWAQEIALALIHTASKVSQSL